MIFSRVPTSRGAQNSKFKADHTYDNQSIHNVLGLLHGIAKAPVLGA